ncbi:DUF3540 domain-containing protein [Bacterioplanoides sp.]|uniref:DUF3540 domain-containing protein n=1 Tax=Bacterioplanoides sp. TaxID=2066072 RepID=UPI003B007227
MNQTDVSPLLQSMPQQNLLFGNIQAVTEHGYVVHQHNAGAVMALKAFSCTFRPVVGDWVSFIRSPDGQNYILTVLRREAGAVAEIESETGVRIATPEAVSIHSDRLELVNTHTQISALETQLQGKSISVHTEQAGLYAEQAESMVGKMMARMRDSIRVIERLEQVRAQDLMQNVKGLFLQRSKQADISAEKDVKINGDRIHMG